MYLKNSQNTESTNQASGRKTGERSQQNAADMCGPIEKLLARLPAD